MATLADGVAWLRRARALVPRADRRVLLSPPRLVARFIRYVVARGAGRAGAVTADGVDLRDPELVDLIGGFIDLAARVFRLRVEGIDHVPASGPVLLVGNHNGGFVPTDSFFTAKAIKDRYGPGRAVYGLAHDFLFEDPLLRSYAQRLGMLRAGHDSALHAFAAGGCVLVYPGSDLDTYRPFRDRAKVVLGGRQGFLRLALRAGVPIVPVVSAGTHEQFIVLTRGDRLARLVHAHAWARTEVLPFALTIPWGVVPAFVPYLPLPAQTSLAFGAPLRWPELGPADAERPEVLAHCYREVEARMQELLDEMYRGRRFLLGKRL